MDLHRIASVAKRILPEWAWSPGRKVLTASLTPIRFSLHTGHFRSSLRSAAVDRHGKPLPWYTYPAIDFLDTKDFSNKTVLEFGSGHSTFWWAKRARKVVSFESDPKWYGHVRSAAPDNAEVFLIPDDLRGLESCLEGRAFEVIIVDGLDRLKAAAQAVDLLGAEGGIILDNSDGSWGGRTAGQFPILELFRSLGFSRVDFYGHAPGVVLPHCTSLFFKQRCFMLRGDENVARNKSPNG
jgi:hypothetical protein